MRGRFFALTVPRRHAYELEFAVRTEQVSVVLEREGQVALFVGRNPFPSQMKRSERSVKRSAMTCALSASGNTLGQSLNSRLVVMQVERWYS